MCDVSSLAAAGWIDWKLFTVSSFLLMLLFEVAGLVWRWWTLYRHRKLCGRLQTARRTRILAKTSRQSLRRQWWDDPPSLAS